MCGPGTKFQLLPIGGAFSQQFFHAHTHSCTTYISRSFFLQIPCQGHLGTSLVLVLSLLSHFFHNPALLFSSWHMCFQSLTGIGATNERSALQLHRVQDMADYCSCYFGSQLAPCSIGPMDGETLRCKSPRCNGMAANASEPPLLFLLLLQTPCHAQIYFPLSLFLSMSSPAPNAEAPAVFSEKPCLLCRCQDVARSSVSHIVGFQNKVPG